MRRFKKFYFSLYNRLNYFKAKCATLFVAVVLSFIPERFNSVICLFSKSFLFLHGVFLSFVLNVRIYWILNTAGITKKDAPVIVLTLFFIFMSPWLYFIFIFRLILILVLIHWVIRLNGYYASSLDKKNEVKVKPVETLTIAVAAIIYTIYFISQNGVILSQGEKASLSALNTVITSFQSFLLKSEVKQLFNLPRGYFAHTIDSRFFDLLRLNLGHISARHIQSVTSNVFLINPYPKLLGEQGVYTHINSHGIFGNSQPGNDYIGKFTLNGNDTIVYTEAKSSGFPQLLIKQMEGLAPEVINYYLSALVEKLVQANLEEAIETKGEVCNKWTFKLLNEPFVLDYMAALKKELVLKNGLFENIELADEKEIKMKALIFLDEFGKAILKNKGDDATQIKINALISCWEQHEGSIIKQLAEAKPAGLDRIDLLLIKKSK